MKRLMLGISLVSLAVCAGEEKVSYLPPYEPHSFVSPKVQEFLESSRNLDWSEDSVSAHYDALGRRVKSNRIANAQSLVLRQARMYVQVSSLNIPEKDERTISAEYRYENGVRHYWLNGVPISETNYFDSIQTNQPFYIPSYTAVLTAEEIYSLLDGSEPVHISEVMEAEDAAVYTRILDTTRVSTWAHTNGYNGSGIGVYIAENGCPKTSVINTSNFVQTSTCASGVTKHATSMVRIFQTTAPNAVLYQYAQGESPNVASYPQIEVGFHSYFIGEDSAYKTNDRNLDNFIYVNDITSFVAAGNQTSPTGSFYVTTPGKALNAITVGGVYPFTNNYETFSRWKNSQINNHKPEIATYDYFSFPNDANFVDDNGKTYNGTVQGTSAATAFSAGVMADVFHQHPFFKHHPEMAKALMITGSTKMIGNATSHDLDNSSIAAHGIPLYEDLGWNTRSRYWRGVNSCCFTGDSIVFTESSIIKDKRYRIAISWLMPGGYIYMNKTIPQDIDLFVVQDGVTLAYSNSAKNPFEVVDFYANSNSDLKIRIKRYANSGTGNVVLGYNMWYE